MSHGAVLSKLKSGFHQRRIAWGFNADHQPVGGKFDVREAELVRGCLLASYITFDLSPELGQTKKPADPAAYCAENVPAETLSRVKKRVAEVGVTLDEKAFVELLAAVWPAVQKMQKRDHLYAEARAKAFTTDTGRAYFRELSIDELPGLTTPETLATMLALIEALGIKVHFVARRLASKKTSPSTTTPSSNGASRAHGRCVKRSVSPLGFILARENPPKTIDFAGASPGAVSKSRRAAATPTRWAARSPYRRKQAIARCSPTGTASPKSLPFFHRSARTAKSARWPVVS
jgi:hypothetical protein